MNPSTLIAGLYLGQLWLKAGLALRFKSHEPQPRPADLSRLTVMQAVMSGDPGLAGVLEADLQELSDARVIWIVDRGDEVARAACTTLREKFPQRNILMLETDEPPAGTNPKLWKQVAALPCVETELLAVIDDDTRVPRRSLDRLINALDEGADLATGLPSYDAAPGIWSRLVAEFVNTSAVLTYLSAAACTEPLSINGMCYAMRTAFVRQYDLFTACSRCITDDLAMAKAVRHAGGRIVQTAQPQHITTTVGSVGHYGRLMHRWFVFTRILVRNEPWPIQTGLIVSYGLHPLLLAALFCTAAWHPWTLLAVLLARAATIGWVNRRIVGHWRHAPLASLGAELLQPVFFVGACFRPVVLWRRRWIRVFAYNRFEYLSP
jgi:ceramide glucosyltransferase